MIKENKVEENHTKIKSKPILKTNENNFQITIANNLFINHTFDNDVFKYFNIDKNKYILDKFVVIPDIDSIKSNNEKRLSNNFLYHKVINKESINIKEIYEIDNIKGDGNCFFLNLPYFY